MIDAENLIGALMQGGLNSAGGARLQNALGENGLGGAGIGEVLGGLLGGGQQGGGGGLGGMLGDILGGGRQGASGGLGGMLGGNSDGVGSAALGGALGGLFGGGGGVGGMAQGGALAILGMLAVNALKNHMAAKTGEASGLSSAQLMAGLREPENDEEQKEVNNVAELIIRAMINAAKADGEVDQEEVQKIVGRLRESDADESDLAYVRERLAAPMETAAIVDAVRDPQVGAQIYAASLMAIQVDTEAEQDYIQNLADGLELPRGACDEIHQMLGI